MMLAGQIVLMLRLSGILQADLDRPTQTAMQSLVALHGITTVLTDLGDFLTNGYISPEQVRL